MKLTQWQEFDGTNVWRLEMTPDEITALPFYETDQRLYEECAKGSIADRLLALQTAAFRLEQSGVAK